MTQRSGVTVVLFTRDLRVHDNPALAAAVQRSEQVAPLFVLDESLLRADFNRPNRARFLAQSLADLDASLTDRGGRLIVRRGDVVREVLDVVQQVGAQAVHLAGDVSGYARRRADQLLTALL
jgi:deoxyribodipyrimidine photo-lyase